MVSQTEFTLRPRTRVRNSYMDMIEKLFPQLEEGNLGPAMVIGILLFVGVSLFNIIAVRRKVASIWMHKG